MKQQLESQCSVYPLSVEEQGSALYSPLLLLLVLDALSQADHRLILDLLHLGHFLLQDHMHYCCRHFTWHGGGHKFLIQNNIQQREEVD